MVDPSQSVSKLKNSFVEGIDKEDEVQWDELRRLLVGDEKVQIDRLAKFLDDSEAFTKEIARVLPRAIDIIRTKSENQTAALAEALRPIVERALKDSATISPDPISEGLYKTLPTAINLSRERSDELSEALTEALSPLVENAVKYSSQMNIQPLSEGLYPVIGPAIRKAVADAFKKINQTINSNLNKTFSVSAIKWRIQSFRTGKPFLDVVSEHTMVFQVQQMFLIHKETGLLLQHVEVQNASSQDADMVSAMLKAIQDFVKDSFNVDKDEALATIEMGEHTIWIEQGPQAILAGVVYGNAPIKLRDTFRNALEKIHVDFGKELTNFDGDTVAFESKTHFLESCLQNQLKKEGKKTSPAKWVVILALMGLAGFWGVTRAIEYRRWSMYVAQVETVPGVIVVDNGRDDGQYYIKGLMAPMSVNPADLLEEFDFEPNRVKSVWQMYQPAYPINLLDRVRRMLKPPPSISLELKGDILSVQGAASQEWLDRTIVSLEGIREISELDSGQLNINEVGRIDVLKKQIEAVIIFFGSGSIEMTGGQESKINKTIKDARELLHLSAQTRMTLKIDIMGYTDSIGNEKTNQKLSYTRANAVFKLFAAAGIQPGRLAVYGFGYQKTMEKETSDVKKNQRRVIFKVNFKNRKGAK